MRSACALFFCLLAVSSFSLASAQRDLKFTPENFLNVVEGLLEGIGAAEKWTDVQPCIEGSEDAIKNIVNAIIYFEKENPVDVAYGLAALAKAFEDIPAAIKSCVASAQDVEVLIKALEAISSPTTYVFVVAKNLIINGVDIYGEIYAGVNDFKAGNWKDFGTNIGEALAQIFLFGTQHRPLGITTGENVLVFLEGVLEGISTDPMFDQIAPCVLNASSVAVLLDRAVIDFASEETERVLEGVALLGKALYTIPAAIKGCGVAYTQLEALIGAISQLKDPRTIVYHIARSLVINGQETWDKINDATTNINGGNYEQAGKAIGAILAAFIEPDAAVAGPRFTKFLEKTASFKVNHNHRFVNWTKGELKTLFGTKLQNPEETSIPRVYSDVLNANLPQNFSTWTQWPQCVHPILDQAHCGSCWAFGAAEALTDRFCIASGGKVNVLLSPQYLVSCSTLNMGCNGGMLTAAWESLEKSGLPTLDCTPYASQKGTAPSCSDIEKGCTDGSALKRYHAKAWSTRWYMSANSIKTEIFQNGPVESAFTVYEDFMSYAGGVYKHTTGSALGGHAIKIIGWGNENGQDYWLVANSWGTSWGEKGYFKMLIGDSTMDSSAVVGAADVNNLPKTSFPREFLAQI